MSAIPTHVVISEELRYEGREYVRGESISISDSRLEALLVRNRYIQKADVPAPSLTKAQEQRLKEKTSPAKPAKKAPAKKAPAKAAAKKAPAKKKKKSRPPAPVS